MNKEQFKKKLKHGEYYCVMHDRVERPELWEGYITVNKECRRCTKPMKRKTLVGLFKQITWTK